MKNKNPNKGNDNENKEQSIAFANIVKWAIFIIFVIVFLVFFVMPKMAIMLCPTVSPDTDISGFREMLDSNNLLLVVASILLAAYSVWQAYQSSKQTEKVLNKLDEIKTAQEVQKHLLFEQKQANTTDWGSGDNSGE